MRIQEWKTHPDFPVSPGSTFRGCWEFELAAGESTIAHHHDDGQEIDIFFEGSGQVTVGEITREVSAGDVIFIPSGAKHLIQNNGSPLLRGVTIESDVIGAVLDDEHGENGENGEQDDSDGRLVTIRDLEEVIESIPDEPDVSTSLQYIIRLFDLAGYISEQIDESMGLENEAGYEALKHVERRVMDAVVEISNRYMLAESCPSHHPRF